jgi:hypothetical protein
MTCVVSFAGLRSDDDGPLGAQTERRVGAGPVGGLLGGKGPPAASNHFVGKTHRLAR